MYYLKARYYSPEQGRFLTKDTFKGFNENPQSLNQYAYCEGNPIMKVDPSGHVAAALLGAASGALTAYIVYWLECRLGLRKWNKWHLIPQLVAGAGLGAINGGLTGWWKVAGLMQRAGYSAKFIAYAKRYLQLRKFSVMYLIKYGQGGQTLFTWAWQEFNKLF